MNHHISAVVGAIAGMVILGGLQGKTQQPLQVRVNRWLAVQQMTGSVTLNQGSNSRSARTGDRLQSVGDGIITGKNSTATLIVDTGIGTIRLLESTKLLVQEMSFAADNGRITRLQVTGGQARLQVRRFTQRGSRLEIQTPAGLSGVRGTDFGITVQPSGKTGMAVLEGAVASSAQGQTVAVSQRFQNFTIPGETPSTPTPLTEDTRIQHRFQKVIDGRIRKVQLIGKVDPVNSVLVQGIPQSTDRDGRFATDLKLLPNSLRIQVLVITPLGKQELHELVYR